MSIGYRDALSRARHSGLTEVVQLLLDKGRVDTEVIRALTDHIAIDQVYTNALLASCRSGLTEVVQLLLDKGAKNCQGFVRTARWYAARAPTGSTLHGRIIDCADLLERYLERRRRIVMLRDAVRARAVVTYWLEAAMRTSCTEGGRGRQDDLRAFEAFEVDRKKIQDALCG